MVSEYMLHPSDNLGALTTSVNLRSYNYSEWATNFGVLLKQNKRLASLTAPFKS